MSLERFVEQTELNKILALYIKAYHDMNPDIKRWDVFDNFRVIQSLDNAAVIFSVDNALFGRSRKRKADGVLGKNLYLQLMDCAAYFIAQNIPVHEVPDELRICLAVCHKNVHWTGVMATVKSFKKFYKEMYTYCVDDEYYNEPINPQDNTTDIKTILRNRAKNLIYKKFNVVLENPKDKSKITPEIERALRILNYFSRLKIPIDEYDSLNSGYYASRIDDSLSKYKNIFSIERVLCSQQKGNTCGEHTVLNLVSSALAKTLPKINDSSEITSLNLRELTNSLEARTVSEIEADAIHNENIYTTANDFISNIVKSSPKLAPPLKISPFYLDNFENQIYTLVQDLFKIDAAWATRLVSDARSETGATEILNGFSKTHKKAICTQVNEIVLTLEDIFKGNITERSKKIFKNTPPEDLYVHGMLAGLIAIDECAEQDHQRLVNSRTNLELEEQQQSITSYNGLLVATKLKGRLSGPKRFIKRSSFTPKTYADAANHLKDACKRYLDHAASQLRKDFKCDYDDLRKEIETLSEQAGEFDAIPYAFNDTDLFSTRLYLSLNHLKDLLQFQIKNSKNLDKNLTQRYHQLINDHYQYEGFIKKIAVQEINSVLKESNPQQSLKKCEQLLKAGKTQDILCLNSESYGQFFLKILSVIGILIGIGIFTTLALMAKRLRDTNGTSFNFFPPLSKTLERDIEKTLHQTTKAQRI